MEILLEYFFDISKRGELKLMRWKIIDSISKSFTELSRKFSVHALKITQEKVLKIREEFLRKLASQKRTNFFF
jgi:hypothetical protein